MNMAELCREKLDSDAESHFETQNIVIFASKAIRRCGLSPVRVKCISKENGSIIDTIFSEEVIGSD